MAQGAKEQPHTKSKKHPSYARSALGQSVRLIHQVCCLAGSPSLIDDIRSEGEPETLGQSIEALDTPALFNWLMVILSYQGISDQAASAFIEQHGSMTWAEIEHRLSSPLGPYQ